MSSAMLWTRLLRKICSPLASIALNRVLSWCQHTQSPRQGSQSPEWCPGFKSQYHLHSGLESRPCQRSVLSYAQGSMAEVNKWAYLKYLPPKPLLDGSLWSWEQRVCAQSAICASQLPMHSHPHQLERQPRELLWQSHSKHFLTFVLPMEHPYLHLCLHSHFH